jgi:hypothetical protein
MKGSKEGAHSDEWKIINNLSLGFESTSALRGPHTYTHTHTEFDMRHAALTAEAQPSQQLSSSKLWQSASKHTTLPHATKH